MRVIQIQSVRSKGLAPLTVKGLLLSLACVAAPLAASSATAQGANACDESCLKGFMDVYLDALSKHQPSLVPTAPHYRYTENGARIPLGEALWVTFNSFGKYRHDVADPQTGGIATFVSLTENHELPFSDLLAVRLKVVDRKITEIETVVDRHARAAENLPPQDPSWMEVMQRVEPESTRVSRETLKKGALAYMRAIAFHDGSLAPFAKSCIRLENGGVTALGPDDKPPVPQLKMPPSANGAPVAPSFFLLGLGCGDQLRFATFNFTRRGNVESWPLDGKSARFLKGCAIRMRCSIPRSSNSWTVRSPVLKRCSPVHRPTCWARVGLAEPRRKQDPLDSSGDNETRMEDPQTSIRRD
ncbi:MAG: hypothetical protein JWL65_4463 [Gammaproteobacteria bacterium]|nr:hypothetical protein [Gammaproteobacteria bacterium]